MMNKKNADTTLLAVGKPHEKIECMPNVNIDDI